MRRGLVYPPAKMRSTEALPIRCAQNWSCTKSLKTRQRLLSWSATIGEGFFESTVYSHEKGAFTGATGPRKGQAEIAGGGTLYLERVRKLSRHS
jgi:transcriptional regulator of aromatic amino acid metabolism